jgi:hypothetical protein
VFLAWRAAVEGKPPDRCGTNLGMLAVPTYTIFCRHFIMAFHRIAATSGKAAGVSPRPQSSDRGRVADVSSEIRDYSFRIAPRTA